MAGYPSKTGMRPSGPSGALSGIYMSDDPDIELTGYPSKTVLKPSDFSLVIDNREIRISNWPDIRQKQA